MRKLFSQELLRFLVVGSTTVLIDFLTYRLLIWLNVSLPAAKAVGFVVGSVFAFLANRGWTFQSQATGMGLVVRFGIVYLAGLGVNVGANSLLLWQFGVGEWGLRFAFLVATALSATFNFLGMKHFVFNPGVASPRGRVPSV
ncbi:MAG: GtrA family protein [Magnetococcales bacterium]|nr:GtrA family protein [Magnetococcales bacterium]MBF0321430.1 GtrA family protein [Magnetococcales bacterium]